MGQPVSRLVVHPPLIDVGDSGRPPSPLPNVTASARAAAKGSITKDSRPSVADDAKAIQAILDAQQQMRSDASTKAASPRLAACLQQGLRGCAAGGGTSSVTSLAGMASSVALASLETAAAGKSKGGSGGADAAPKTTTDATASTTLAQRIDRYLFPPPKIAFHHAQPAQPTAPTAAGRRSRRGGHRGSVNDASAAPPASAAPASATLLWDATSSESHYRRIRDALSAARGMRGADGLRAVGFEFRRVPCERHRRRRVRTEPGAAEERGADERTRRGWGRKRSMSDGDKVCIGRDGSLPSLGSGLSPEKEDNVVEEGDKADQQPARERSQSDPLSSSLRRDFDECYGQHWMEIMPTHPANAGDVVESAAIRERRVRGFADPHRFQSDASLETVDYSDDDDGDSSGENARNSVSDEESTGKDGEDSGRSVPNSQRQGTDNKEGNGDAAAGKAKECEALPGVLISRAGHDVSNEPASPTAASRFLADLDRLREAGHGSGGRLTDAGGGTRDAGGEDGGDDIVFCPDCVTRLHHIQSSTVITPENRTKYIADGDMYDEVARLCQEHAHDLMAKEGNLEWVTVCNDRTRGAPVRALVDRGHVFPGGTTTILREGRDEMETLLIDREKKKCDAPVGSSNGATDCSEQTAEARSRTRPTLLIVTGKGKVRAGVFSRFHLISSGIEPSTALPMVREARRRDMAVVLLDPNARGDKQGMETFERSVEALFGSGREPGGLDVNFPSVDGVQEESKSCEPSHHHHHHNPLYILAYSASGGQLVRYLMDAANPFLSRIRAIAFTDSTHNFQWARNDPRLSSLLESPSCVYVRSANASRDGIESHSYRAGEEVRTNPHWRRRFGAVRTVWAGTAVHELANWAAHAHIWEHFDRHFHLLGGGHNVGHRPSHQRRGCGAPRNEGSDDSSAASGAGSRGSRRFRSRDFGAITV